MKPVDQMSESDARQRLDIIAGYLETLLRNAWDDLDTVGLLHEGMARGKRVAADDALVSLSMAQELVRELQSLGTRPWPKAKTA